jgi:anti-anti-sigma regulatory factor
MSQVLTIRVRREPQYAILTAVAEIDIATVSQPREQLFALAGDGRPLVADLDQVVSSTLPGSGPGRRGKRAAARGSSLHVVCARPQTRRLFGLTGLDSQIPLARTLTEAPRALAALDTTAISTADQPSTGDPWTDPGRAGPRTDTSGRIRSRKPPARIRPQPPAPGTKPGSKSIANANGCAGLLWTQPGCKGHEAVMPTALGWLMTAAERPAAVNRGKRQPGRGTPGRSAA